ncbi:MAG: restriction endonuclease subunit S [Campylobacter sp.]|uniref:restriction endonuclease subunit S n=1 Tax=Campylobacter sp. TaxID=205 RepID=UPI00259CA668|nr:restriction endonuclease subunit S [Campylobacter sp.]MBE6430219.1 restriction endonuclease subunit S [Campylobacter sp.]
MQKPSKLAQIPQIRFVGFTGDWEWRKLELYANFLSGNGLNWNDISDNGEQECILYGNLYTDYGMIANQVKYKTNTKIKNPVYSKFGDVLIPASDTTPTGLARATCLQKENVLLGNDINIIRPNENINGSCLSLALNANKSKLICLIKGTTVRHIHSSDIKHIQIALPSQKAEQQKIGELFANLDNLITLHQRKVEKLQKIKKSCLQNLFPQNNQNTPKIRFKNFSDEWVENKLGKICTITMGQSPNGATYSEIPSDYILVQGNADLKNGFVCPRIWTTQKTKMAYIGDLIMSVRAPAGAMGKTLYNVVLGRGIAGIKGNEFIYQNLIKFDMEGYWSSFSAGSTFESLNSNVIFNAKISIPNSEEQEKIGAFFSKLDKLITLQQRKVEKLKNIKKALLNNMFI